jgi:hypothetical protein
MTLNQDAHGVGILMLVTGISLFFAGLNIVRKYRSEANYSGIGSFRFTRKGVAWLAGYLLVIFGVSLVFVSAMVLFL